MRVLRAIVSAATSALPISWPIADRPDSTPSRAMSSGVASYALTYFRFLILSEVGSVGAKQQWMGHKACPRGFSLMPMCLKPDGSSHLRQQVKLGDDQALLILDA